MDSTASSSSLSPPMQLRPRGCSASGSMPSAGLAIQPISLAQAQASSSSSSKIHRHGSSFLSNEPQTPSELVRKNTAPTTIVQEPAQGSSYSNSKNVPTLTASATTTLAVPQRQSSTGSSISTSSFSASDADHSPSSSSHPSSKHHAHHHTHRNQQHHRTQSKSKSQSQSRRLSHSSFRPSHSSPSPAQSTGYNTPRRHHHHQHGRIAESYAFVDDDLERETAASAVGGPHRPMLSVLLSLGVNALPAPFARRAQTQPNLARRQSRRSRLAAPSMGSSRHGSSREGSANPSARSSFDRDDEEGSETALSSAGMTPSPSFASRFILPPPRSSANAVNDALSGNGTGATRTKKLASTSFYLPILSLLTLFVATLLPIGLAVYSLPLWKYYTAAVHSLSPSSSSDIVQAPSFPPRTMKDITALSMSLRHYATSSAHARAHVLFVMSITAVWKHAWSIPGSVVLNVIAGTLYSTATASSPHFGVDSQEGVNAMARDGPYGLPGGILFATLHMTLLTTLGSIAASALSMPLAPLVRTFFPRALDATRVALEGNSSSSSSSENGNEKEGGEGGKKTPTWVRLVIMRLVGIVPWSGINVACGVVGVSWWDCFAGGVVGTMPWTAVTCQIGDIIQTLSSSSASANANEPAQTLGSVLASPTNISKLILLSALSLGPVLYRDKLSTMLGGSTSPSGSGVGASKVGMELRSRARRDTHHARSSSEADADETHLLPLSYTAHDHTHTPVKETFALGHAHARSMSVPAGLAAIVQPPTPSHTAHPTTVAEASSEASSTVGGDEDLEMGEPESMSDLDDEVSSASSPSLARTETVRMMDRMGKGKSWSGGMGSGWTMWAEGEGEERKSVEVM